MHQLNLLIDKDPSYLNTERQSDTSKHEIACGTNINWRTLINSFCLHGNHDEESHIFIIKTACKYVCCIWHSFAIRKKGKILYPTSPNDIKVTIYGTINIKSSYDKWSSVEFCLTSVSTCFEHCMYKPLYVLLFIKLQKNHQTTNRS